MPPSLESETPPKSVPESGAGQAKPFRVLCLDGGGMRGAYTAAYLDCVARGFATQRGVRTGLDVGAAFDLIVGTSTGGMIGCALVAGLPLESVIRLYRERGPAIFPMKMPKGLLGLLHQLRTRPKALAAGAAALRQALQERLGDETVGQVYARRGIALAITAVELSQHRSWVFKTRHLAGSMGRDDDYSLVDVCMATSAAPIFRSLAAIRHTSGPEGYYVFADGGLWANNPVMVALVDALQMAPGDRPIEIFSLGTCPLPAGEQVPIDALDRGFWGWRFGSEAASLSIAAQEFAFDNMARMIAPHFGRPCRLVRFPRQAVPAALMPYLGLDETRAVAVNALINQARRDAEMTNSVCTEPASVEGPLIRSLFMDMPERTANDVTEDTRNV